MRIIAFLISFYIFGSFFTTLSDLVAIQSVLAANSQPSEPSQPLQRGDTNRR